MLAQTWNSLRNCGSRKQSQKAFWTKENENTTDENVWNVTKAVLRSPFITLSAYVYILENKND